MIKLLKHAVKDTETGVKARVRYSHSFMVSNGRECVTLYAKDYGDDSINLKKVFADLYENNTDIMTDYFEKGLVRIFTDNPLFEEAKARCSYIEQPRITA